MKTIKFYTLGCKVNQYDTQSIREQFLTLGYKEVFNGQKADIYCINTCTVTHRADADSLRLVRCAQRENPNAQIIVTGCLAELDAKRIREVAKSAVIEKDKDEITKIITGKVQSQRGISYFEGHTRAFLKIQDGCDNLCSYCKVPLVRGRSASKPLLEIIEEARRLVKNNFKEIVLTGICLGAYGKDLQPKRALVEAIAALEQIKGLARIRLSSIEAGDVTTELIEKIRTSAKLCRHLHIPMQSGDNEILKAMNRKYRREYYLKLVRKIKKRIPSIAITTDCLVGFPGESEDNFKNTLDLIRRIKPLRVHVFGYSKREGTQAVKYGMEEIDTASLQKRVIQLKTVAGQCAQEYKERFLSKKLVVLIESRLKQNPQFWEGYTDNYIRVIVRSKKGLKNQLVRLKLKEISGEYIRANFH